MSLSDSNVSGFRGAFSNVYMVFAFLFIIDTSGFQQLSPKSTKQAFIKCAFYPLAAN